MYEQELFFVHSWYINIDKFILISLQLIVIGATVSGIDSSCQQKQKTKYILCETPCL